MVSTVTGSERVLSPGTNVVLEVVRMAVNEQFPTIVPTLYPASKTTDPRPYVSLGALWRAFSDLAHNKTPVVNGEKPLSLPVSSTRARSSAPSVRAPARRSWARPGPSAAPVAFVADGIEPFFQLPRPSMIRLTLGLTTHRIAGH